MAIPLPPSWTAVSEYTMPSRHRGRGQIKGGCSEYLVPGFADLESAEGCKPAAVGIAGRCTRENPGTSTQRHRHRDAGVSDVIIEGITQLNRHRRRNGCSCGCVGRPLDKRQL